MAQEMARLTLEVLEHTLFSQGLGRDTSEFQKAVTKYFNTVGRPDPFDMLGLPQFLPRFGRLRGQATLEWFAGAVEMAGSWWPDWHRWVAAQDKRQVKARLPGDGKLAVIEDAPGAYVKVMVNA